MGLRAPAAGKEIDIGLATSDRTIKAEQQKNLAELTMIEVRCAGKEWQSGPRMPDGQESPGGFSAGTK